MAREAMTTVSLESIRAALTLCGWELAYGTGDFKTYLVNRGRSAYVRLYLSLREQDRTLAYYGENVRLDALRCIEWGAEVPEELQWAYKYLLLEHKL